MRIKAVEFEGAIGAPGGSPPGRLPQVAFSGRSNVGKSSLINRLLGRTRRPLARVSGTPGRTQEIHFYRVRAAGAEEREMAFYLVDLPGYGYARVPLEVRKAWRPLIEGYLSGTPELRGVVQILDARHPPTAEDVGMAGYLAGLGVPALFVLTKVDRLGRAERPRAMQRVVDSLGIDEEQAVFFSAKTGEGREELLDSLEALLREGGEA